MSTQKPISFEKWEGLGNDFVLIDAADLWPTPAQVQALCDRRRGVGGDGVLVIDQQRLAMTVFNADGSRPEMCGNGLRCAAAQLSQRVRRDALTIRTDAGDRHCRVTDTGHAWVVEVEMGVAKPATKLTRTPPDLGGPLTLWPVDMGNPHVVSFEPVLESKQAPMGAWLERETPGGTNVEYVTQRDHTTFDVIVWERGVGFTQACGTGACAVAVAACNTGRAQREVPLTVNLPGGPLTVVVNSANAVRMTGPARLAFAGRVVVP